MPYNLTVKTARAANVGADVDAAVAAGAGLTLLGYSVRENAGTPALCSARIINGPTGATATPVIEIALLASTSQTVWMWPGVPCPAGLSVDWIAGQFSIELHYCVVG